MNNRTKKFFSYYRPYLGLFYADMACAIVVSLTVLAIPLCIRFITKNLEAQSPDSLAQIYWTAAVMLGLVALHAICHAFVDYKGHLMGAYMERDMRNELFEHYQKLSFQFYDDHRTGELMTRISSDTYDLAELFHHGPEDLVVSLMNFVGALVILLMINVNLALLAFLFVPVMGLYGFYFSRKMQRAIGRNRDRIGNINTRVEDALAGIRVVKSFTNEAFEQQKFQRENERFLDSRRDTYKNEAYFYDGLVTMTQLMTLTVVLVGAVSIVKGHIDLADLLTFLLYLVILIEPVQRLGNFNRLYQEGITGFHRFMDILESKPDIQDTPDANPLADVKGDIRFYDVSFKYREGYDHVLKNINLTIHAGDYVALVGPSGAGKTTLCSLIPRFYDVTRGTITLDGKDIKMTTLGSLRRQIGLVQQDVFLFAGTVADNIRYGNLDASDEQIVEAAKNAHAHDFILSLPDGYATDIGQRGVKLSGGQKQRLSIARVFLKNPPILIFDEATSSLDNESERAVQSALEKLIQNRTTIVIAHRLSTIRNAKRILVLTENGVEEQGSHQELLALNGVYTKLYNTQLSLDDVHA